MEDLGKFNIEDSIEKKKEFLINKLNILSGQKPDEDGRTWSPDIPDEIEHSNDIDGDHKSKARSGWSTGIALVLGFGIRFGFLSIEMQEKIDDLTKSVKQTQRLINQTDGEITQEIRTMTAENIKKGDQLIDEAFSELK
jgi:hypothetical protein